jgi:glycosyltransferase involved in cell wall biosynthesis
VLLLIEGDTTASEVEATLRTSLAAAPPSSLVGVVKGGIARVAPVEGADPSSFVRWPLCPVRSFDGLRALLDGSPGADLVLVEPPRNVSADTLRCLARAAYADSACATVSELPSVARSLAAGIPPPAIDQPAWGLVLIRRDVLEVTLEDARLVAGVNSVEFASIRELLSLLLDGPGLVHRATKSSLAPSIPTRPALNSRIRVIMDVRFIAGPVSGTQVQFLSLLAALARIDEIELTALAPAHIHPSELPLVEPLRADVVFSTEDAAGQADIFHRPHQVHSLVDLADCLRYGHRFVLTQQDMIVDRAAAYWASPDQWKDFRRATQAALASADQVGFFSEHAALDALSDGMLDPERATVVPLGVNHVEVDGAAEPPPQLARLGGRPFLLMIGTALLHKNRLFGLRVLRELVNEQGWEGGLVLAGADFPWGSSTPKEHRVLARDARLRQRVVDVGAVSEAEKRALYRDAGLVLFPSFYEGFGLIPFEAAAFGTPCLYAWRGPVAEFLPQTGALPADFSVKSTASMVLGLLGDVGSRNALVSAIRSAAEPLTWEETARGYLELYRRSLERPPRGIDRAILASATVTASNVEVLTPQELAVISAYRRRTSFKALMDSLMLAGTFAVRAGRRGQARLRRGGSR